MSNSYAFRQDVTKLLINVWRIIMNLNDKHLKILLNEINNAVNIMPLSNDEVDNIEQSYQPRFFSRQRVKRDKQQLKELKQEFMKSLEPD